MTEDIERRHAIQVALSRLSQQPLRSGALALFEALGYRSDKVADFPDTPRDFVAAVEQSTAGKGPFNHEKALVTRWQQCAFLFQITDEEVPSLGDGATSNGSSLFGDGFVRGQIESFVFIAIELQGEEWSRTQLAGITRALNQRFPMPAIVLFKHGSLASLAVIDRRINKRNSTQDVLEQRITVIKDVRCDKPHRAHLEILASLAIEKLSEKRRPANFVDLYAAWIEALSVQALNNRFYKELANWYFWAIDEVQFPDGAEKDEAVRNAISVIRLITRLIFVWFIKERQLVPEALFEPHALRDVLKQNPEAVANDSTYYKAILQNLFFATLSTYMGDARRFRGKHKSGGLDSHHGIPNVFRYENYFSNPSKALELFAEIPFLNGGLFECLDKRIERGAQHTIIRVDGFSDRADNPLQVPNKLFFAHEIPLDLNETFGTRGKKYSTRGLIHILNSYKFTVDENTPLEQEVALDPELLGKVFENLLASYNPETATTARKQTGSFYTPREIVDYMVDESLLNHLADAITSASQASDVQKLGQLRSLLSYSDSPHGFSDQEVASLIGAIDHITVLDPACGSGAFPMGMLLKLVHVLGKLDPGNQEWKARQVARVERMMREADGFEDADLRVRVLGDLRNQLKDLDEAFERNQLDYGRKLYLIQNCIFGVDIQPIAVQIAKLRCFISLIVNETIDSTRLNRGIRPLPNLETKFVAANSLIDIERPQQGMLSSYSNEMDSIEHELRRVREKHFHARTQETKDRCRAEDHRLRDEMARLLTLDGFSPKAARKLADWNPYDQNHAAPFFDTHWMFGLHQGFDIVIGNPPYLRVQGLQQSQPDFVPQYRERFKSATGSFDIYALFVERGYQLLSKQGQLAYILPHKFFQASFAVALRKLLTKRKALRQVMRFGAEQVFEEATTYTCLLFLAATPNPRFDLFEVRSLAHGDDVLKAARMHEAHPDYAYGALAAPTDENWDFALGESNKVLARLKQHPRTLGDITRKIFQGIATSADKIYVLELLGQDGDLLRCYSKQLECEVEIERGFTRPFLMGKHVHRYEPARPRNVVVFPYWLDGRKAELMTQSEIRKQFPLGWKYLKKNRQALGERERDRMHGEEFYAYIYPKNLVEFDAIKVMTPEIALGCQMTLDAKGICYHTTKVYSVAFNEKAKASGKFWLGILNSKVLWYFITKTGYVLRGGYYTFKTDYLNPFPIPDSTIGQQEQIERLVDIVLALREQAADLADPPARVAVMTAWFEQLIDALTYELYFPEEFVGEGTSVGAALGSVDLPASHALGKKPAKVLEPIFERLYDPLHPVRKAMFALDSIAPVRVIEGKA